MRFNWPNFEREKLVRTFHLVIVVWALSLILISAKFNLPEEDRYGAAVSNEFAASNDIAPPGERSLASQAHGVASQVSN